MSDLEIKLYRSLLQLQVEEFRQSIKEARPHLINKELSLEERWLLYIVIRPFLEIDSLYWDSKVLEKDHKISWYDDFYLERGETLELDDDFIERALEKFPSIAKEDLKEEILEYAAKSGYGAFENDW